MIFNRNKTGKPTIFSNLLSHLSKYGINEDSMLIMIAMLIGILTGLGSLIFTWLVEFVNDFCYGSEHIHGIFSGQWYYLIILPALGALLVGTITYIFAREARGHGVPEVMDAIARKNGIIRGRVAIAKSISSALTIGSGGSAGTEGPIIQIGAAIGSSTGQLLGLKKANMSIIVGCGAAAGISAIFHAPIAGVLFALEVFLRNIKFKTFSPVLIASVISSVTVSTMLGSNSAIFPLTSSAFSFNWYETFFYLLLGLTCAFPAIWFCKALYATEDFFDKYVKVHYILKPVIGAALLGIVGIIMVKLMGGVKPAIFGNGYNVISECIKSSTGEETGLKPSIMVLIALLLMKTVATCFTLGSGGSGGVFAPSLMLGAVTGNLFGMTLNLTGLFPAVQPENYALVGMAAVVAASSHAPMTAIMIVFEMTRNYQVMLPLMLAVTIALFISQLLCRDSIYTMKLTRRGVNYQAITDMSLLRNITVQEIMHRDILLADYNTPLPDIINLAIGHQHADFVIMHNGNYCGTLNECDLRDALLQPEAVPLLLAGELTREDIPTLDPQETLDNVLNLFSRFGVNSLPVRQGNDFTGMITRADLISRYQNEINRG